MSASLVERIPVDEQLQSLTTVVRQLQQEVCELRRENTELRQQVSELVCDVGYWKSMHARAVERNTKLQAELDQAKAEIRQLKAERFGKQSEKRSAVDRSNHLDDPQDQAAPKKKRGQQPGRPAPKRRDYSHLPAREKPSRLMASNIGWLCRVCVHVDREATATRNGNRRASYKGYLSMGFDDYLRILDWIGRQVRSDKRGR